MTFGAPDWLFCFLALPLVVFVYVKSRQRRGRRSAALATLGLTTPDRGPRRNWRGHVPFAIFLLALALLVVAFARPMATIDAPRREATVIVAIDISNSMDASDVKPTRFAAAASAASAFVKEQPSSVKIGVVAFGPSAVIVQPPTLSRPDVIGAIKHLSLGGGTSLGAGILTALDAISGKTLKVNVKSLSEDNSGEVNIGYYGGATIVVFSDGEDTSRIDPVTVARLASTAGVRIQTVGLGTASGTTVKIDGFTVATALDSRTLKAVAAITNGSYHQTGDRAALGAISKTIDLHFAFFPEHTEISAIFAAIAAVFLVGGALISVAWFGRVM
jgi:Ca-activated chloride channel family protein